MRLEWLEDILAVVDTGSFHSAAEVRFLTPSAFTRRIRLIEQRLGCELFDRSRKPIVLNRHARDNLPQVRDAVATLQDIKRLLSDPGADRTQRITMMCQHTLTASLAPTLVEFISKHVQNNMRIRSGTKNECQLELIKQQVDLALVYESIDEPPGIDDQFCESLQLGQEEFVPVVNTSANEALAAQIADQHFPIIAYPRSIFLGQAQHRAIARHGDPEFVFSTVVESGLGLAVAEFVRRGIGVGWLPVSLIASDLRSGELVNLADTLPSFALDIKLLRLSREQTSLADDLWQLLQSNCDNRVWDLTA